jgi:methyl-galactoside transport system ATP-binding protein
MSDSSYVLRMEKISKSFPGVRALDDVSLNVRPGSVHALMGENGAGKSTLMKCLFGLYLQDEGVIYLENEPVEINDSRTALDLGISMIHQELHPVPYRNVMENFWLGRLPEKGWKIFSLVDHKSMLKKTRELFEELEIDIDPRAIVRTLSVSKIQSMEIAKAVSYNSRIIIMDEPTSSLTGHEVHHLFRIIKTLKERGIAIIYISHKMEEILEISDEVTIMRDGRRVGTWHAGELTTDLIISRMVGRDLTHRFPPKKNKPAEVILKVENFTSPFPKSFKDVSFTLRRGEILGVGGLVGAQRTEVMEALFGIRSLESGSVEIEGKHIRIKSPIVAKKNGMALLTEERRVTGIFPMLSVWMNLMMANIKNFMNFLGLLHERQMKNLALSNVKQLRIKTPNVKTQIRNLSGGNQQKVLVARWLNTDPEILILDEPTRGIDVGAKFEIYTIMSRLAMEGKSIIMISSEMPELLGMSDRILVMCEGRVSGIIDTAEATEEKVMTLATQFMT